MQQAQLFKYRYAQPNAERTRRIQISSAGPVAPQIPASWAVWSSQPLKALAPLLQTSKLHVFGVFPQTLRSPADQQLPYE